MLQPLLSVALFAAAQAAAGTLQQSVPQSTCIDLVSASKDQAERDATYGIYTRCRLKALHGGFLEPGCRELARLYSVARHYKDASGSKLAAEEFCATAVGSALEEGPMQEVDACVAGAEEVLSSSEVSEAAETACRKAHPKAAEAPAACRMFVAHLAEAIQRSPEGELVDAESICGQLVGHHPAAPAQAVASPVAPSSARNTEEGKFVSSCVQFAGNLMNTPNIGEDQVRKSCESHLSSEEKNFCSGYARLVSSKADASEFSNFCLAEYRRMSLVVKSVNLAAVAQAQQKKVSSMAMSMPALCAAIFSQAVSATLSGPNLKRAASDLCTQELNSLDAAQRPPAARIRVGCNFFGSRLVKMKEQQQGAVTSAEAFCSHIGGPQRPPAATTQTPLQTVAKAAPIQPHAAALIAPVQPAAIAAPAPTQASVQQSLPELAASAALPALAAAVTPVQPVAPSAEESAKAKSNEDFLSKFLDKYEASNAAAEATAAPKTPAAPVKATPMNVLRDDEMAEIKKKAEQLFGSDVEPEQAAGTAAMPAAAVAAAPVPPAPPATPAPTTLAAAVAAIAPPPLATPAAIPAVAAKAATPASSKKASLLSLGNGQDAADADFLSSFLSAYTGGNAATPAAPAKVESPLPPVQLPDAVPPAAPVSPLALLEAQPPSIPQEATMDVDSLVSSFLAKNGH